jgi:signal transduction histidine kinase/ActR/RegA family two-component response regulator
MRDAWMSRRSLKTSQTAAPAAAGAEGIEAPNERRSVMRAIAEEKSFSQGILDTLSTHIAVLDEGGTIVWTNAAWREFAAKNAPQCVDGFERKNYLGVCDRAAGPWSEEAGKVAEAIREMIAGRRESFVIEYPCHSPAEQRWFIARITRLPGNGPVHLVLSHQDITREKLAEEALRESENRMEENRLVAEKLESTGRLSGGIAHDFNNLLGIILGNIDLVRMRALPGEEIARYLSAMQKAVLRAQGLTQRLITFSKGGAPIMEPVSLAGVLEKDVRTALGNSNVTCEISVPQDLWRVMADEGQIGQVIQSMLFNAQEAMPEGGAVSLRARNVVVGLTEGISLPEGKYVCVEIADHGVGIAEEILPKIFDPYFSTRKKRSERGLGLGLAICRSIIQKQGGTITVASTVDVGTMFHVYLPATGQEAQMDEPVAKTIPLRPSKILVMDDEELILTFVRSALIRVGCDVGIAENGEKAVALYREAKDQNTPFAAVILDLTVQGGMGGLETFHRLREIDPAVKAIASSGATDDPVIDDFKEFGFVERLIKPYSMANLRETLLRVFGS